ncbi:ubiquitin recognition factor in ER-associated degradation protein 1 isoform X3 [Camelus ferus]|uniref:Ubiquitin recognition factor in ER-associated degradation protein 1 isoform X3 n=1 Tax=Camelus ferus TaxID=419612 RepID=A0A8B8SC52_CAMFR|nr:ubiquitin recognition factor in ER-associated degradation protein 1 isoform X3 [Camelus ferus]
MQAEPSAHVSPEVQLRHFRLSPRASALGGGGGCEEEEGGGGRRRRRRRRLWLLPPQRSLATRSCEAAASTMMMQNLLLEEGGLVQVESVNLQVATYSKFQPQSPDFLDITNPKAVLENALRNFACLTTGDVIAINYNEKIYELRVMETKPDKAVSIIECDMNVDFDAPLGYKEPERQVQHEESAEGDADPSGYAGELGFRGSPHTPPLVQAFSGSGNRLDGKKKGVEPSPSPIKPGDIKRGIPNYEFKLGKITFIRNSRPLVKKVEEDEAGGRFVAFSGEGQSLRKKGRKP